MPTEERLKIVKTNVFSTGARALAHKGRCVFWLADNLTYLTVLKVR